MTSSVIGGIRGYFKTCPLLENGVIRVNYLGADLEYTIDEVPGEAVLKRYTDGSTVHQTLFILASTELYSRDALENLKVCGFYEQLSDWLEKENRAGRLPELPAGAVPQKIETTTNGYCISADIQQNVQRYQIQCRLLYFKEAN